MEEARDASQPGRSRAERVYRPPDRFIPVTLDELQVALAEKISKKHPDRAEPFQAFCRMLIAASNQEASEISRRITRDFRIFWLASKGVKVPVRANQEPPSEADLDERELQFLADLFAIMKGAYFSPLAQDELETAIDEEFTFLMPVKVHWERLDSRLLRRFWAAGVVDNDGLAEISDRVLIFHRGIKTARAKGLYIQEKIDLLVAYLFTQPFTHLVRLLLGESAANAVRKIDPLAFGKEGFGSRSTQREKAGMAGDQLPAVNPSALAGHTFQSHDMSGLGQPSAGTVPAAPPSTSSAASAGDSAVYGSAGTEPSQAVSGGKKVAGKRSVLLEPPNKEDLNEYKMSAVGLHYSRAKVVERITLQRLMPDAASVIRQLGKSLELQEPSFQHVVVIYRADAEQQAKSASEQAQVTLTEVDPQLVKRNINIKYFENVPMADLEMVFPNKSVYIKPVLLIQLIITLIGGLITAFTLLFEGYLGWPAVISATGVLLARASTVYFKAELQRTQQMEEMGRRLYDHTIGSQEEVIRALLEEMAEQHIKAVMIAYALLLIDGAKLTQEELDIKCERWLEDEFGAELDFAVEHALPQLLKDGVVSRDRAGRVSAAPLEQATRVLSHKWELYLRKGSVLSEEDDEKESVMASAQQSTDAGPKRSRFAGLRRPIVSRSKAAQAKRSTTPPQSREGSQPKGRASSVPHGIHRDDLSMPPAGPRSEPVGPASVAPLSASELAAATGPTAASKAKAAEPMVPIDPGPYPASTNDDESRRTSTASMAEAMSSPRFQQPPDGVPAVSLYGTPQDPYGGQPHGLKHRKKKGFLKRLLTTS